MQPPFPCENKAKGVFYGYCAPGVDVYTCEESLKLQCAPEDIGNWFLDGCGGHARPYHHHNELSCYYDHSTNTHSPLVGIAKDGYGIYGIYEKDKQAPTDLDACNGHYGPVPELKISNYESTLSSTLDASGLLNTACNSTVLFVVFAAKIAGLPLRLHWLPRNSYCNFYWGMLSFQYHSSNSKLENDHNHKERPACAAYLSLCLFLFEPAPCEFLIDFLFILGYTRRAMGLDFLVLLMPPSDELHPWSARSMSIRGHSCLWRLSVCLADPPLNTKTKR